MAGILELKINVRHTNTGGKIRTVKHFTYFSFQQKFNSLASTFSFDFYFDPTDKEHAEIVCVSHMHESQIYYNGKLVDTGYILTQEFFDDGKPSLVPISGYSKPGVFGDCDIPPEIWPLEIDGMSLKQIIETIIAPFGIKLVIEKTPKKLNKAFVVEEKDIEEEAEDEDNMGKTAADSAQNIASYISDLAKQRNIPLSHDQYGNIKITTPNTRGTPLFNFDFTSKDPNNDANKIPGIKVRMVFNGQALHTHIYAVQQSDDEEGTNAIQSEPLKNPLIPIKKSVLFRPRVITVSSGNDNTVNEAARYELGREIREGVVLEITIPQIEDKNGDLIMANNMIAIRHPKVFLYTPNTEWFIQSVDISRKPNEDMAVLNCVLPFGYDYDLARLKNVFVDPHENLPRF